jgi:hypothetical protein
MSEPLDPPVPPIPPPPSYAPPPPPGPPPGTPTVRISDWLNQAWAIIQPYWLEYVLAILVAHLVLIGAELLCILPILIVAGPMMGGVFVYLAKRMLGLPAQVSDVFKGFRRFVDTMLLGLALILPPLVLVPLLFLPTILAAVGFGDTRAGEAMTQVTGCVTIPLVALFVVVYPVLVGTYLVFALPLVLFRRMSATEAIRQSIETVKPQLGNFLLFTLADLVLLWAASFVGGVLICVGFLILSPLAASLVGTMQLLAYRDFFGLTPEDLAPYAD